MPTKYKYKSTCKECNRIFRSNWRTGSTSAEQKMLRHKKNYHKTKLTEKEQKTMLEN